MDVSVIIPTFNRLWCLPKVIESCRDNNCRTEIVVIDDGSTDGTWEWLKTQTGLITLRQDNQGKCWAANKAFKIASGKYVRFLDSDDLLTPGSIDRQFILAEDADADIVVSGTQLINREGGILKENPWIICDDFIAQQLGECDSSHYSAYLFRKDFIADIPHRPDFEFRDDRMFVLEAAINEPVIVVDEVCALQHRAHLHMRLQLTTGLKQSVQNYQHLTIYKKILMLLSERGKLTPRRIKAATKILWPLAHWIAKNHPQDAVKIVDWILELDPGFKIPEEGLLGLLYKKAGFRNTEKLLRLRRYFLR